MIRRAILESGWATPPEPTMRNPLSPDINSREQLGKLQSGTPDEYDIASHLTDPIEDEEDCYGPVPPDAEEPYVGQDPFVRDYGPLPTPPIKR